MKNIFNNNFNFEISLNIKYSTCKICFRKRYIEFSSENTRLEFEAHRFEGHTN